MLKFFRKHARGWFMIAVIAVIIIVFVLYFGSNRGGRHANAIAIIDKKVISEAEFHNEYEKMLDTVRMNLGGKLTPEILKKMDLKRKAYDNLINRQIVIAKADDLKIQISDEELRNTIMSLPVLQTNGVFDERKYQQVLRFNKMTAEEFENLYRADLTANKIEAFVREGVKISDREIQDFYDLQNRKINVSFLQVSGSDIRKNISPSQSELEDYLKHNGNFFRVPDQTKMKYIFFSAVAQTNITDADIKNYYASYKDTYKTKDGKQLSLSEARSSIIKELKKSRGIQGAYLEAKKARDEIYQENNMEDYGRKNNLKIYNTDFFTIHKLPAELASIKNFSEALLDLQKDDVSKVITAENGCYLFQVVDKKSSYIPKLNDIASEVTRRFLESEKQTLAAKEAQSILERLKSGEDLGNVARENGLKINETGFFQLGKDIPKVGPNQDATETLMQLSMNRPYADKPLLIKNNYVIFKLRDVSKPDEKNFEVQKTIYSKILNSLKQEEAMKTWLEGNKASMIKEKRLKIKKNPEDL